MPSRNTPWLLALLALTAVRLVVAAWTPLSPDEAYYWVWSRALAPGYLDHPPMVALWVWLGTALAGDTPLGVRLLAPVAAAAGSLLVARAAADLFPGQRAGVPAAALLNGTLLFGVGAVTMTPDTPLLFFWAAAIAALARLARGGGGTWWLAVGAAAGMAMASKYTGAMLGVGIVLWLAAVPALRRWFASPFLWAGGGVAAAVFAPVVLWNAGHDWASFVKQGGRTGDWEPGRALRNLGELLAGQIGLATPLVAVLLIAGIVVALRRGWWRDPAWTLLAAMTSPGLLVFLQHAVGDRVQANWPAIIYPAAAIAGGTLGWRWRPAVVAGLVIAVPVYLQSAAAPFAIPRRFDPTLIRLGGWDMVVRDLDAMRREADVDFVASENYGVASLLALGMPPDAVVLGAEPRWAFTRLLPGVGSAGLLLVSERRSEPPDPAYWTAPSRIGRILRTRNGVEAEAYQVYRVTLKAGAPAVRLPHRGDRY